MKHIDSANLQYHQQDATSWDKSYVCGICEHHTVMQRWNGECKPWADPLRLIWVYTVKSELSVQMLGLNMVQKLT